MISYHERTHLQANTVPRLTSATNCQEERGQNGKGVKTTCVLGREMPPYQRFERIGRELHILETNHHFTREGPFLFSSKLSPRSEICSCCCCLRGLPSPPPPLFFAAAASGGSLLCRTVAKNSGTTRLFRPFLRSALSLFRARAGRQRNTRLPSRQKKTGSPKTRSYQCPPSRSSSSIMSQTPKTSLPEALSEPVACMSWSDER